jgi:uncharacterized protein YoxC
MAKVEVELSNGAKAGETLKELTKEAVKLRRELGGLKEGTAEFVSKSKRLNEVKDGIGGIKEKIDSTRNASDAMKKAFLDFIPFGNHISQLSGQFINLKGGVGGLTNSFGLLRGAIISTGIGALLVLLGLLINALSKFTPLIDKVEQIMSGLSSVLAEVTNRLQGFASGLWDIITGAPGGLDKVSASWDGLGDSMLKAYEAGVELKKLQQDLEDLNRAIVLTNAKQETQIDLYIKQTKNKNRTDQESLDILEKAKKVAEENFKVNQDLDKKNLDALLKEAELNSKLSKEEILQLAEGTLAQEIEYERRGQLSDDLLQKITDAQVKVVKGEGAANQLMEKIATREAAIRERQEADREKARQKELKRQEELQKAYDKWLDDRRKAWDEYYANLRNLEDLQVQAMQESREKDLSQLKLNLQRQIEAIDINAPFYSERIAAAQELARQKRDEINKKWNKKEIDDQLAELDLLSSISLNDLNQSLLNEEVTREGYATRAEDLAIEHQAKRLEIVRAANGELSAEYQKELETYLELQQQAADRAVAIKQKEIEDQLAAMEGSLGTFGNFFGSIASMQKQGTEQWKAFASAQAVMSALQSSMNAYQSTAAIPIVGPALAPIAAGLALAVGMQNVRKIQSTKVEAPVKKAARGLWLEGPSHAENGIPFTVNGQSGFEAEGGEALINKRSAYKFRRELSAINSYNNWGRKFEAGGPINPLTTAQLAETAADNSASGGSSAAAIDRLENSFNHYAERVDGWARSLKVQNVVTETEEALNTLNRIKEDANA